MKHEVCIRQGSKHDHVARSVKFFVLVMLVGVVVVVGILEWRSYEKQPTSAVDTHTVPYASSETTIYLDAVEDPQQNIHLIWRIEEAGVQYQRSGNSGKSWTNPTTLAVPTGVVHEDNPRIFYNNNTISVFWWDDGLKSRASNDGGQTWSDGPHTFFGNTFVPRGQYAFAAQEGALYLTYLKRDGLFVSKSDDLGQSWRQPVQVSSTTESYSSDPPAIAVHEESVYLLWHVQGKLFVAQSGDGGITWSDAAQIDTDRSQYGEIYQGENYPLQHATITASDDGVSIFYQDRGVFYQQKQGSTQQWSSPIRISPYSAFQLAACSAGEQGFVVWADTRYRERDWWDIIPGGQLFIGDPYWANSDLFVRPATAQSTGELRRLTSPLSLVSSQNKPSLSCGGDRLFVLWSGRKKVGKTVDEYGYPVQIFFRDVSLRTEN